MTHNQAQTTHPDFKPNLLVVDDEPEVTKALYRQFRRNYNVLLATSVKEALQIMQEQPIHVVISDQRMPDVSGVEFLAQIKDSYPNTIRVLITGYADIEAVISAINDGSIFRYVKKPWDREELEVVIREAFEHNHLLVDNQRLLTELHQSEQRYRSLFEDSPITLWEVDYAKAQDSLNQINVEHYNRATAGLLESNDKDEQLSGITRLLTTDMQDFSEQLLSAITAGKQGYQCEKTITTLRNNRKHVLVRGSQLDGHGATNTRVIVAITDISTQKQAKDTLKTLLNHELEMNALRSRIIETIAHEFRTPLAVIHSSSEILTSYMEKLSTEQRQNNTARIHTATNRITHLLDDALAYSKSEASEIQINPTALDLIKLSEDTITHVIRSAQQPRQITLNHSGECASAVLDRFVAETALTHLLQNAVHFSPDGGAITCDIHCGPQDVSITVKDEGIGIPQEDQPQIFEAFSRASNVGTIPGVGLGLAIVKRMVELHGGTISCQSKQDAGATFIVTLPYHTPSNSPEPAQQHG